MEKAAGYTIKIQNFEGPLDLLFHLIEKSKMDIYDIQITEITDQYIEYLRQMEQLDLEIASEFLVMASTLLLIKSRMLLPKAVATEEEVEDLKDELINRLVEYKKYKEFTKELKEREAVFGLMFYKAQEVLKIGPVQKVNKSYSPKVIPAIYAQICTRNAEKLNLRTKQIIAGLVVKEKITIRSKIREIVKYLVKKAKFKFSELFCDESKNTKMDIVTAFMALLELAKVKRVTLDQKENFAEIFVKKVKSSGDILVNQEEEMLVGDAEI